MSIRFPHLSLLARALVTCLTLLAVGIVGQAHAPGSGTVGTNPVGIESADVVAAALTKAGPPDVLAKLPLPAPTAVPATPTPVPPVGPLWGQATVDTPLRLASDTRSPAGQFVPRGSYLRLLRAEGTQLHVRYGGDGHEHKPAEGWVNSVDVAPSPAPGWVETTRGAALLDGASPGSHSIGILPADSVLEVREEQGKMVHVFFLGDGFSRDPADGWVDVGELGPAGPTLVGEKRGVRFLTRADAEALESGNGVWLRVPYRTQMDGSLSEDANCGPASVGMVLQLFRTSVPTGEVRATADRLQGTSDPEGGFAIEFLAAAVKRYGLRDVDLGFAKNLRQWTLDDARRHLSQGHPVIPQLRYRLMPGRGDSEYGEDHYVVLTGMRGDDFIYNDSVDVDGRGYGRIMSAETLARAWGNSYFPFAAFAVSSP